MEESSKFPENEKFSELFELSNDLYSDETAPKFEARPCSRPTTQQIILSKSKLTKKFVLENAGGFDEIEEITQLILRGREKNQFKQSKKKQKFQKLI